MNVDEDKQSAADFDVVEPEQAEAVIEQKALGDRIRRLRMKRSMGLVELGKKTDLSASFLSQLETGRVVPTVRNLARIAMAFQKDLSYFFHDDAPITFRILRQQERVRLQRNANASANFVTDGLAALISDSSMSPCIAEFRASEEEVTFQPRLFEGIEFTFVMAGRLTLVSETETRTLESGDVAWLDGVRRRRYTCEAGHTARAMFISRHRRN